MKIGDMGVSKIVSSSTALYGTRVGTPLYLSPEIIKQEPYDYKVDVWAFGCVLYNLTAFEPPFSGENLISLGTNIVHKTYKPVPSIYSKKLCELINKALSKTTSERPTIKALMSKFPQSILDESIDMPISPTFLSTKANFTAEIKEGHHCEVKDIHISSAKEIVQTSKDHPEKQEKIIELENKIECKQPNQEVKEITDKITAKENIITEPNKIITEEKEDKGINTNAVVVKQCDTEKEKEKTPIPNQSAKEESSPPNCQPIERKSPCKSIMLISYPNRPQTATKPGVTLIRNRDNNQNRPATAGQSNNATVKVDKQFIDSHSTQSARPQSANVENNKHKRAQCYNFICPPAIQCNNFITDRCSNQFGSHETRNKVNQMPLNSYSYYNHNEKKAFDNFTKVLSFTNVASQMQVSYGKPLDDVSIKDCEEIQRKLISLRGPMKPKGSHKIGIASINMLK